MSKGERKRLRKPAKAKAKAVLRKRELVQRFRPHYVDKPRTSPTRSIIKTGCYRVISATETGLLAWLVVPVYGPAVFTLLDSIGNTILYYLFERTWAHIDLWASRKGNTK